MKSLILSQSDNNGGAARAALRLHQALISQNLDNLMFVGMKKTDLLTINTYESNLQKLVFKLKPKVGSILMRLQSSKDLMPRSPNYFNSGLVNLLNRSRYDVINIHWVNNEFLSIEDIGRIDKPKVITLHDMWAFCGTEHYANDGQKARWREGYSEHNRPSSQRGIDIDRWAWTRKLKAWTKPMHIVTPSNWLAECVKNSTLMRDWQTSVIPNPIDIEIFQPWPKDEARDILGLPKNTKLVLFGAFGGSKDPRKGWKFLQDALLKIERKNLDVECVVFGQNKPYNEPNLGLPIHWMGHISDDKKLALLYSSADVMLVPSLQENLPQSGTEAQACGCPVVAFNCTGLPDVVAHKKTGYLATPYDTKDLANGIDWILASEKLHFQLSRSARQNAVKKYANSTIAKQYQNVYQMALNSY